MTINVELKELFNELNAVVITAGAFEASDEKKNTILKPLDIVTTAGADGDIYGALETLPGASKVGNDDGLYVRGGSDYETKTVIDGMTVNNPYYSTLPDIPSRGRHDAIDEVARHRVGHALHRRARALRHGHHLHDLRQHGGGAHML